MAGEERFVIGSPQAFRIDQDLRQQVAQVVPGNQAISLPIQVAEAKAHIPEVGYLALAPGSDLHQTDRLHLRRRTRQMVAVGHGELVVIEHIHGHHTTRCALPGYTANQADRLPVVQRATAAVIHRKAIGFRSLGNQLILFFDAQDHIVARLDSSLAYGWNDQGAWEYNLDALDKLCQAGGIAFSIERFDTAADFLQTRSAWSPARMEFEIDHLRTERIREWGLAVALGLPMAGGLLTGLLVWGPIGWLVQVLEMIGVVTAVSLTVWSHSKWRMRRSLRHRGLPVPETSGRR